MKIYGLQKMTLLDFPERVACTIFLSGCDFKCLFCHNYELVDGSASPLMDEEELLSFLKKRQGLLDGVAITGGEPCLHRDLPELIKKIRKLGFAIKLDTEGYHPEMLKRLFNDNMVDYAAMDIKNSPEKYARTVGVNYVDMDIIRKSISLIKEANIEYEFRTTVIEGVHETEDFYEIGELIKGADKYFIQPFTDRDTVPMRGLNSPGDDKLNEFLGIISTYVRYAELRGV